MMPVNWKVCEVLVKRKNSWWFMFVTSGSWVKALLFRQKIVAAKKFNLTIGFLGCVLNQGEGELKKGVN